MKSPPRSSAPAQISPARPRFIGLRDQIHRFRGCAAGAESSCFRSWKRAPDVSADDPGLDPAIARLSALSPAEQSVLDQALTGVPAREIADRLVLSEATVRSHLSRIYVKLGVSGRVALLAAFRDAELPEGAAVAPSLPVPVPVPASLPRPMQVVGWAWILVAGLEAWYAVYLLSLVLGFGGSQQNWYLLFVTGALAAVAFIVGRAILVRPTRKHLLLAVFLAAANVVFAGVMLPLDQAAIIVVACAAGLGWLSFRAWQHADPVIP